MKFELEEYHRNVPDQKLILDLLKIAEELNKETVTYDEYNERGAYCSNTLMKRFGSWNKALERAGLQKKRNINITEEELFQNLEEVWVRLGRQPRREEIQPRSSRFSSGTYERRFGTWRKALESFVKYVNNEENISSENAIKNFKVQSATRHKTTRAVNWRLRFLVMRRDNFKCKSCGRSPAVDPKIILHVDHVIPYANGGETVFENLQTLCSVCNIGKSNV